MSSRHPIVPILLPHGRCLPGCPHCPLVPLIDPLLLLPTPAEVAAAVDAHQARSHLSAPVELAFYGGDIWQLPRRQRTDLLDAAEREVRRGRAQSIRLTLAPGSVLRAPLRELCARGVRAIELPVHSMDARVMRQLGVHRPPRVALEALGRLHRMRLRSVVHLSPGLPGSTHRSALASAEDICRAHPSAVRVLPALALDGTLLGSLFRQGGWQPMRLSEATSTCKHLLRRLRASGIPVIRVGLQPEQDLLLSPEVLAGPYDASLRLLVETELMRITAMAALTSAFSLGTRAFTFAVHPREESFLRGPQNRTLRALRDHFRLDALHIVTVSDQPVGQVRAFPGELPREAIPSIKGAKRAS